MILLSFKSATKQRRARKQAGTPWHCCARLSGEGLAKTQAPRKRAHHRHPHFGARIVSIRGRSGRSLMLEAGSSPDPYPPTFSPFEFITVPISLLCCLCASVAEIRSVHPKNSCPFASIRVKKFPAFSLFKSLSVSKQAYTSFNKSGTRLEQAWNKPGTRPKQA